jgi:hypothetical protein
MDMNDMGMGDMGSKLVNRFFRRGQRTSQTSRKRSAMRTSCRNWQDWRCRWMGMRL